MRKLAELSDMTGRVALITGGAGHIGRAMAAALAEQGADLILIDRDPGALDAAADRLRADYGGTVAGLVTDLEDADAAAHIADFAANTGAERLDVLVNNAAFVGTSGLTGWVTDFEDQGIEAWNRALQVNLTAGFALSQACAPLLRAHGTGAIVNVGSIYGMLGPDMSLYDGTAMGNPAAYAASKGGLLQLTRWLATVLAPDIRVNAITPGGVARGQPEVFAEKYTARTPMGRMATEEDFKGAVAYLASDLSGYVTGQNIVVDGGWGVW